MSSKENIQNILSVDMSVVPTRVFSFQITKDQCRASSSSSVEFDFSALTDTNSNTVTGQDGGDESGLASQMRSVLESMGLAFDSVAVIIPSYNLVSFNLSLPFSSNRMISQVVQGEVQEQVPWDIDSFHIHYDVKGGFSNAAVQVRPGDDVQVSDVRVTLVDNQIIESLLKAFQVNSIEPVLLTTPGALLPIIMEDRYFGEWQIREFLADADGYCLIYCNAQYLTVVIYARGGLRTERSFPIENYESYALNKVRSSLFRVLGWAVRRYDCALEHIVVVGLEKYVTLASEVLLLGMGQNFKVHSVSLESMEHQNLENLDDLIPRLAAIVAQEDPPQVKVSNLRSGVYSYSPILSFAISKFFSVVPFVATLLVLVLLLVGFVYGFREYQINTYQKTIRDKIVSAVPELQAPQGAEGAALKGLIRQTEEQLKKMNIFSDLTPFDVLGLITKNIKKENDVEVVSIYIERRDVVLRGTAPDHATIEKIKRAIKRNSKIFCKVRKQRAIKSGQKNISFEFQFEMCQ